MDMLSGLFRSPTPTPAPVEEAVKEVVQEKATEAVNSIKPKAESYLGKVENQVNDFCTKVRTYVSNDNYHRDVKPKIDTLARILIPAVCAIIQTPMLYIAGTVFSFTLSYICRDQVDRIVNLAKETWNLAGLSEAPFHLAKIPLYFFLPTITSIAFGLEAGYLAKKYLEGEPKKAESTHQEIELPDEDVVEIDLPVAE